MFGRKRIADLEAHNRQLAADLCASYAENRDLLSSFRAFKKQYEEYRERFDPVQPEKPFEYVESGNVITITKFANVPEREQFRAVVEIKEPTETEITAATEAFLDPNRSYPPQSVPAREMSYPMWEEGIARALKMFCRMRGIL